MKAATASQEQFNARLRASAIHADHLAKKSNALAQGFEKIAEQLQREHDALERIHGPMRQAAQDVQVLESLHRQGKLTADQYAHELERIARAAPGARAAGGGNVIANQRAATQQATSMVSLGPAPSATGAIGGALSNMAAGTGVVAGLTAAGSAIVALDEKYVSATNSMRKFFDTDAQLVSGLAQTQDIAYHLHLELGEATKAFDAVGEATQSLNLTTREQMEIFKGLGEVAAVDGGGLEEMTGMLKNLQYGMEVGTITGLEMKRMIKGNDDVAALWADALGVTQKQLVAMAGAGKITSAEIRTMMLAMKGNEESHRKYEERSVSLAQKLHHLKDSAMEPLSVAVGRQIAEMEKAWEPFNKMVNVVARLSSAIDDVNEAMARGVSLAKLGGAFASASDVIALANKQMAEFDEVQKYTGDDLRKGYHDALDKLNRQLSTGMITQARFDIGLKAINKEFGITKDAVKVASTAIASFIGDSETAMDRLLAMRKVSAFNANGETAEPDYGFNPRLDVGDNDTTYTNPEHDVELEKVRALYDEIKSPMEAYQEKLEQIREVEHLITGELRQRMLLKAKAEMVDAEEKLAEKAGKGDEAMMKLYEKHQQEQQAIADGFGKVASGIAEAAAAGEDFDKIMVRVAASILEIIAVKALSKLFTDGIGAAVGGSGLSIPGFATGGMIGPGGSGGVDSQLIALRKSPNETLRVHTPDQEAAFTEGGGAKGGGGTQHLTFMLPEHDFQTQVESNNGSQAIIRVITRAFPHIRKPQSGR